MCEINPALALFGIFLLWTVVNSIIFLGFIVWVLWRPEGADQ